VRAFIASGRPFLGICVGLQMLFQESEEPGAVPGLGVLPGRVVRFRFEDRQPGLDGVCGPQPSPLDHRPPGCSRLKVPHIGWNELRFRSDAVLFQGLDQGDRAYFVHSYYARPEDPALVSATSEYGGEFCCAVEKGSLHATQFHPEKSGSVGLRILRNFANLAS